MNKHVSRVVEHVVPGKRLGRHLEHDPASRAFAVKATTTDGIKSVEWKRHCPPFDQGELGSCTGNAMAGAKMTEPLFDPAVVLSEDDAIDLYKVATALDDIDGHYPPEDTGSSGLAVCKAAMKRGYISRYTHAFTMAAALNALQKGPVICGVNWYSSFDAPAKDGTVSVKKGATIRGGHEVEAFKLTIVRTAGGVLDMKRSKVHFWNSWGTGYGVGGAFCMTLDTWGRLMNEGGDVTVPHA